MALRFGPMAAELPSDLPPRRMADEFVQALDKLVEVSGQLTDLILGLDVDALGQAAIAGDMCG